MNEPAREPQAPERDERGQDSVATRFAVDVRDQDREERPALHRVIAGTATTGSGLGRLTQLLASTINRRVLGGLFTGALRELGLAPDASGKSEKSRPNPLFPIYARSGLGTPPDNHGGG